jgi:hypothetical protein
VEGSCENRNEPSGSIYFLEVLEQLHNLADSQELSYVKTSSNFLRFFTVNYRRFGVIYYTVSPKNNDGV